MTDEQDTRSTANMLKQRGKELGFHHLGIAAAVTPPGFHPLLDWISRGFAADMTWIHRRRDAYEHPDGVLPETRSVIVGAINYHNQSPLPDTARIARYAWSGHDYHCVLRDRLRELAGQLQTAVPNSRSRVVVDTAPLLERDFARLAGVGWFGKNTMLISREIGSWFFLGAILTTARLAYDEPYAEDYCGTCTRCIDACPTDAFPEPYLLDSNRCISYHTIENRSGEIPQDLAADFGNWIFGCDICQEVCPWNRFAPKDSDPAFHPRSDLHSATLQSILDLTEDEFQERFQGTPLERTGFTAIQRNARIAMQNMENG
ncbi:MAG: tRNA epoxyqueuosine(34) reductase QueG [Fuerstiella sp.]|nr:tRNA epoxyqueuosine(34) reductase QueG [Fuerstiella sp.]